MSSLTQRSNYKWVILVLCFFMVFICLGFCSSGKGLYLTAITKALGLKRSLFSINDTCRYVSTAVANIFFGTLIYRFGVRKMIAVGFLSLIASTLLYARAESIYVFYLGGILLGIGMTFTSTGMASAIIRRWFHTNVGMYTGIVLSANGLGGALAAQIISPIINREGDAFGYRTSYMITVAILVVVGILVVIFMREAPEGADTQAAAPAGKKVPRGSSWVGIDYQTAVKRPYFYFTALGVALTGFILQGSGSTYIAHMTDVGMDPAFVANMASVGALSLTVSKLAVGALYDRWGLRPVLLLCQGSTVAAFLLLAVLDASPAGRVGAFAFALLHALSLPLETLVVPLIANEMFGSASYEKILGILVSMNYAGYSLSAPLFNLCYDLTGSYRPILLVFSVLMVAVCIMFQWILKISAKEKQSLLEKQSA